MGVDHRQLADLIATTYEDLPPGYCVPVDDVDFPYGLPYWVGNDAPPAPVRPTFHQEPVPIVPPRLTWKDRLKAIFMVG